MMETQIPKKISDAIGAVLPGLPDEVVKSVEDTLEALGATTTDDLQYITEGDLLPVLKPILARRLVAAWAQNVFTSIIHGYLIILNKLFPICAKLGRQFLDTMAEAP